MAQAEGVVDAPGLDVQNGCGPGPVRRPTAIATASTTTATTPAHTIGGTRTVSLR